MFLDWLTNTSHKKSNKKKKTYKKKTFRKKRRNSFKKLDKNRDGKISRSEWKRSRRRARTFNKIDKNRDGIISLSEWKAYKKLLSKRRKRSVCSGKSKKRCGKMKTCKYIKSKKGSYCRKLKNRKNRSSSRRRSSRKRSLRRRSLRRSLRRSSRRRSSRRRSSRRRSSRRRSYRRRYRGGSGCNQNKLSGFTIEGNEDIPNMLA